MKEKLTSPVLFVPFADLHQQYISIRDEIDGAIADVIRSSAFIRGPYVERFEQEFAEAQQSPFCISCANGTDALYIAMVSLGLRRGDEVIVPAMSWISTSESVTQAGGQVVFCDIDSQRFTIDVEKLADKITERTVGIIPVHLYGQPADMGAVMAIAEKHSLWVIEDCAQAHLAAINGKKVGTYGAAGTFSFYPGKNLGAMGDAGAIVTQDAELADRMAMFARHGGLVKGEHTIEGINSRMDGIQAAILSVKLRYLIHWTEQRRACAAKYAERLSGLLGVELPMPCDGVEHVWHLYVICLDQRTELADFLAHRGVQTVINYPRALPYLPCYESMGHTKDDFPVASTMQNRVLSLPIYPEISEAQIDQVTNAVFEFFGNKEYASKDLKP